MIMNEGRKILEGPTQLLLSENMEKYVVEIYGANRELVNPVLENVGPGIRTEFNQDTLFAYSNDTNDLSGLAGSLLIENYHVRQVNLEDLFLKVTGRGLNELQ